MNPRQTLDLLRRFESRNVTFIDPDGSWPIIWERARGVVVRDARNRRYLDLTAAFGVAAAGHANPRVVRAGQRQMGRLLHAMGDVHPHELKARLARELSRITFERWAAAADVRRRKNEGRGPRRRAALAATGKTVFCNSGFEAVEVALKTALLASGKPGVIAFQGAYHGLGYGTLNATHRDHFRGPFLRQLREFAQFVPFPSSPGRSRREEAQSKKGTSDTRDLVSHKELEALEARLRSLLRRGKTGAILVEPVQARGGIQVPPPDFLPLLRRLCDEFGVVLILDEIYTGFGRTGRWFACEHSATTPDLICLGKALTGGFPLSACVGRADLMDAAWPPTTGEAIHTSTFLGHPVGCAMALAQIQEIERLKLCRRSARLGRELLAALDGIRSSRFTLHARGVGLMAGLDLRHPDGSPAGQETGVIIQALLRRGFILLPEGEHGNVLSFTPPLTITSRQLNATVQALKAVLNRR
jgi:4-aminobutyrate aminotransferase-like enzyme